MVISTAAIDLIPLLSSGGRDWREQFGGGDAVAFGEQLGEPVGESESGEGAEVAVKRGELAGNVNRRSGNGVAGEAWARARGSGWRRGLGDGNGDLRGMSRSRCHDRNPSLEVVGW